MLATLAPYVAAWACTGTLLWCFYFATGQFFDVEPPLFGLLFILALFALAWPVVLYTDARDAR